MGILSGIGAGFSFGIICITPQNWLDEVISSVSLEIRMTSHIGTFEASYFITVPKASKAPQPRDGLSLIKLSSSF